MVIGACDGPRKQLKPKNREKMSLEELRERSSGTNVASVNETARLAKLIVSLFSPDADSGASETNGLTSGPSPLFNSTDDLRHYYLLNNPRLKKDEAVIHMYILFVLLCYVIGTGLIIMKYMRRDSSACHLSSCTNTHSVTFMHTDSGEVWVKSAPTSCETVSEGPFTEDEESVSSSDRLLFQTNCDVTYV